MLDPEYAQGSTRFRRIGAQVKYCTLPLAKICEVDIEGDHAPKHGLVRIRCRLAYCAIEILGAIERVGAEIA